jgi:zinc-finger of transposase IS204/IS1001/IS1096/IS1165
VPPSRHHLKEVSVFIATPLYHVLTRLLPDATTLHLEGCEVADAAAQITLRVQSTPTRAPCPLCATPARRIHSHYERILADLPWAQYRVPLQLRVRKWFCPNRSCRRRIFTERLPTIAARGSRAAPEVHDVRPRCCQGHPFPRRGAARAGKRPAGARA